MFQGFGFNSKSARVADQIDAEVKAGKSLLQNANMVAQQFDFYEQQLAQFAQMLQAHDPSASMQFQLLQQQINNTQTQIVQSLQQVNQLLNNIDSLTDKIQN